MNLPQEKNPTSFMTTGGDDDSGKVMPLGVGDMVNETGLDPLAGVSEGRKFNAGSFVLVIVVVVACAGLWFMKSLSKVGAASTGTSDVEASIEKFISSLSGKSTSASKSQSSSSLGSSDANVLAVLSSSYTERQIPLDGVKCNPFIIYGEAAVDLGAATPGEGDLTKRRKDRERQFHDAIERLQLKSVLMGSQPLANIGGKIVRKGEELVTNDVAFRVAEIEKDAVTLVGEDVALDLSLTFTVVLKR